MNFSNHPSKIKKVFSAILPGILVAGLIFAANTYYDLDLGKVIVQEITRIVGQLETTATTTLAILGGNVGIGTTTPAFTLDVNGTLRVTGTTTVSAFVMPTGASAGYVLTSDASGVGTWQPAQQGISGSGTAGQLAFWTASSTISGDNNLYWDNTNKRLGIGTTGPSEKLEVVGGLKVRPQVFSGSITQTTDTDFSGGTFSTTSISGTGEPAKVQLAVDLSSLGFSQATSSAQWSARYLHTSVVFDNKIWVIGGVATDGFKNDVWYSTDGVNWTQATSSAQWSGRLYHTSVVFDNKIWVIGGYDVNGNFKKDVWYSTDGVNWTQATANAPWSARYGHTSVVFDNKIWVIGGYDGTYKKDVWYSTDGVNWTQATANAPWSARYLHTSVVFDNKIWVIGGWDGAYKNDVWYSTDGVNWTQATSSAQWSPRYGHTSVVFDNKIWVIGGYDVNGNFKNDVWYSTDGVNWTQATSSAQWSARRYHTSVVFDNKIWVIGGYATDAYKNDVWYSTLAYYPSGTFISSAIDTGQSNPDYTILNFNITKPANTDLKFRLRSAPTQGGLASATWYGPTGTNDYYTTSGTAINSVHYGHRWIQYQAYFSTTDNSVTPSLEDITINYSYTTSGIFAHLIVTQDGKVGINTHSPVTTLEIAGTTTAKTILPKEDNLFDLGSSSFRWANIFAGNISGSGNLTIQGNSSLATTTISTQLSVPKITTSSGNLTIDPAGNLVISKSTSISGDLTISGTATTTQLSVTSTSTLGTVISGTWQGTAIGTQYGGTGQNWSNVATGSLPYFSGLGTLGTLSLGSPGQILAASTTAPYWASLSSLSIATGTGATNYIAKWTGTNSLATSTITDDGTLVLVSNQFRTTATTTLATSQGNVGIGTTTPTQKLHVEGQCVTGDTKLAIFERSNSLPLTAHRVKEVQIKDVKPGQYVYSLNEKTGKVEPAKINKLLDMGVKPVFKLVTDSGKEIKTTGNHPYLAITQNSKVKSQNDNSKFKNINPYHLTEEYEFSETKVIWENKKSNFLISNSSMLDMSDLDDIGFNKNELHSIISNPQSILFKLPSFELLYFGMLKGMVEPTEIFNLFNNLAMNFEGQSMKFFFSSGMEKAFEHKENNYLFSLLSRALNLLSTSFKDIQDLSRSASFTLSSVSPIAEGLDHSIRSTISSNNSLERNFEGAKTPRMFSSSMIVNGSDFAIQSNGSKDENELSMAKWTKVIYLEPGDEIATVEFNCKQSAVSCEPYLSWEKIKSIEFVGYEQVYDIEVEGTHNFVANGILAHNTYISGNVGIGTTAPSQKLTVAGNIGIQAGANAFIGTLDNYALSLRTNNTDRVFITNAGNVGIGTTAPSAKLHSLATTEQLRLGYDASNAVKFTVDSTNALTITPLVNNTSGFNFTNAAGTSILNIDTSNQRVGIGTTEPIFPLTVAGAGATVKSSAVLPDGAPAISIQGEGSAYFMGKDVTNDIEFIMGISSSGEAFAGAMTSHDFSLRTNNTNRVTIKATTGNVGIGTTAPSAKLHSLATNEQLRLGYDDSNAVKFTVSATNALTITPLVNTTSGFNFTNAAGTSILNIDTSNQRVGIGTTAPSAKLHSLATTEQLRLGYDSSNAVKFTVSSTNALTITPLVNNTSGFNFTNAAGTSILNIDTSNQRVGIGTTAPSYKLDVASGGAYTARFGTNASDTVVIGGGAGKLSVGTFDPVYNIGGKKFATYGLATIGIKEETVGTIKIERKEEGKDYYFAEIDFNNLTEGSDLWLFSKITALKKNINKLSVFLTPNSRTHVWYQVDPENFKLYFFAEKPTIISYRLIAPRFDFEKWKNTLENEEGITGLIVEEDGEVATSSFYKLDEENNKEGLLEKISSLLKTFFEELEIFFEKGKMFVEKLLTKEIETEKITTQKICSKNGKCVEVTDELIEKLNNLQQTTNNSQPTTDNSQPTPTEEAIPSPTPESSPTPSPSPTPTPETTPTEQPTLTSSP
jgi:hypothetical protein